jgi:uncharacterized protein
VTRLLYLCSCSPHYHIRETFVLKIPFHTHRRTNGHQENSSTMSAVKASTILRSPSSVLSRLLSTRPLGDVAVGGCVPRSPDALEWLVVIPDRPNVVSRIKRPFSRLAPYQPPKSMYSPCPKLERRVTVRPKHSLNFAKLHQEGYVSWAGKFVPLPIFQERRTRWADMRLRHEGPLFENHVENGRPRPFKGSAMVVNDQSKEAVLKTIGSDVYVREGVWDLEKALVLPVRTIMRRDVLDGRGNARGDQ